jgi:hypothetical protein
MNVIFSAGVQPLGRDDINYYYLPILKNAHNYGKIFFSQYDFLPTKNIKDKKCIIFIREPIRRWISGICQWFNFCSTTKINCIPVNYQIDYVMMNMIFSAVNLDHHTIRQRDYFANIDLDNCIFFNLDSPNFNSLLKKFINNELGLQTFNDIPVLNKLDDDNLKINIRKQLLEELQNPKRRERIQEYYRDDILLYNNLLFKNANRLKNL